MLMQRVAITIGVLALLAAGCGALTSISGDGVVIDGWLVGPLTTCQDVVVTADGVEVARGRCEDLVAAAANALDDRDPGHPAVVEMQLHERRWPPNTVGGLKYVAVYTLADGSVRAIGVGFPGVATTPYTIEYGP